MSYVHHITAHTRRLTASSSKEGAKSEPADTADKKQEGEMETEERESGEGEASPGESNGVEMAQVWPRGP